MKTINLKNIIELQGLDTKEVAKELFPYVKYPMLAIGRILSGEALLDSDQISRLALMSGLSIAQLFSGEAWKNTSKDDVHTFTNGEYKAVFNLQTGVTQLYHLQSMFHEEIIHSKAMPLNEYLKTLDTLILNHLKSKSK